MGLAAEKKGDEVRQESATNTLARLLGSRNDVPKLMDCDTARTYY